MEKEVKINVVAPVECTEEQFEEWVKYCTGYTGSININNPLHEYDLDATYVDV